MWTHTRQPPSVVGSAEIASSKSRAVTGSIVNVGSSARSRRPSACTSPLGGVTGRAPDGRIEAAVETAVEHQRRDHVAGHVRTAEPAQHPRPPRPALARGP